MFWIIKHFNCSQIVSLCISVVNGCTDLWVVKACFWCWSKEWTQVRWICQVLWVSALELGQKTFYGFWIIDDIADFFKMAHIGRRLAQVSWYLLKQLPSVTINATGIISVCGASLSLCNCQCPLLSDTCLTVSTLKVETLAFYASFALAGLILLQPWTGLRAQCVVCFMGLSWLLESATGFGCLGSLRGSRNEIVVPLAVLGGSFWHKMDQLVCQKSWPIRERLSLAVIPSFA